VRLRDLEIGLVWLSFPGVRGGVYLHNPFPIKGLRSFGLLQIGFVFSNPTPSNAPA
jgi:hypothetical protein